MSASVMGLATGYIIVDRALLLARSIGCELRNNIVASLPGEHGANAALAPATVARYALPVVLFPECSR